MSLCYTRDELIELSSRKRKAAVVAWLQQRGVPYILDADGWPKVLRGAILDQKSPEQHHPEPRLRLV